jgi:ABC-type transporter Mla MlaB component
VQVELLAPRTLGLVGPVLAEDADRLLEAIASLAPGGPITLDLTEVTSIDQGGVAAIRRAATKAHDIGGVLVLLLPEGCTYSDRGPDQGFPLAPLG